MREYELTVVFDLAVAESGGADAAPNHVDSLIAARGGTVLKHDHWGRRRMAYPINRAVDGDYVVSRVELDPAQVTPLEAVMKIDERIYRHLIVRADELPVPPPPREPRRIPGETAEAAAVGSQPSATGDSGSAEAVATEADGPSTDATESVADALDAEAETAEAATEPVAAAVEDAEPAAEELPEVESPLTEALSAAVESPATEAEAPAEAETDEDELVPQEGKDTSD